jgi:uncharacterized membrane protein YkvA (DUF1232 family)
MDDSGVFMAGAVDDSDPRPRREVSEVLWEGITLIPNTAKLVTRLVRDPRVSIRRKIPIAAAVGYILSPIDIIPNSILGIGMFDDAIVVSLGLNALLANTDPTIIREHWDGSIDALDLSLAMMRWGATLVPGRA